MKMMLENLQVERLDRTLVKLDMMTRLVPVLMSNQVEIEDREPHSLVHLSCTISSTIHLNIPAQWFDFDDADETWEDIAESKETTVNGVY